jgi:hypothetical protein
LPDFGQNNAILGLSCRLLRGIDWSASPAGSRLHRALHVVERQ